MLFHHNTNPEIQRAFAEVLSLMSSTLQLSVHTVYKGIKKKKRGKNVGFANIMPGNYFTNLLQTYARFLPE